MATINGTFNSLIAGTLSGTVATPGAQGPAGPTGPAGAPGVGVPAGGLTGQILIKASGTSYDTAWTTLTPGATESWVTTNFLSKAGNLSGLTNLATARDNLQLGVSNIPVFNGVQITGAGASVANLGATFLTLAQDGQGQFTIQPSQGIVWPDTTIQTTAFNASVLLPYAPLASPLFTGDPRGPTAALGDNDTSLATTAFVQQELLSGTANARNLEVYVRNQTGSTIAAGSIVYINGATGNRPTITLAQANNDANSAQTMGFTKTSIANNAFGFVIVRGEVENLNTSALTEGVQLYLSPTTAGTWTTTKPSAPQHLVYVGICVRAHPTLGVILVAVQNGYELPELHDVKITSPTNGQVLKYDSAQSLWVNGTDSAPVTSVAGRTGAITLSNTDISGLGTMATATATDYLSKAGNLSGLASTSTARTNLGLGTMATATATDYLSKVGNLSGLANLTTARDNLQLGAANTVAFRRVNLSEGAPDIDDTLSTVSVITSSSGYSVSGNTASYVDDGGGSPIVSNSGAFAISKDVFSLGLYPTYDTSNPSSTTSGIELNYVTATGVLTLRAFDTVAPSDYSTTLSPTGLTLPSVGSITFGDATVQTTASIGDAPSDGNYYVRMNGAWIQCTVVSIFDSNTTASYNCLTV